MDKGTLTVTVECGRNLGGSHTNGFFLDSYCCLFLYDTSGVLKNTKQKTKLAKRTSHPEWNESFDFFVNPKVYGIYVVVKRKGTFKSSSFLGSVSIPASDLQNLSTTPVVRSFQLFGKKASGKKDETQCGEIVLRFVFVKSKDKLEDISSEISKDRDRSKRLSIQSLSSISSTDDPKRALKLEAKSKKLQKLFNTPTDLRVIEAFSCAYQSHMPHQGTLYLTEDYLFFKSLSKKLMIKLAHIQSIEKKLIPGSIRIAVPSKEYVFVNLYNREKAITLITETRENSIKGMNSETESFRDDFSEASMDQDLQSVDTDTDTDMDTNSSYPILSPVTSPGSVHTEESKPTPVQSPLSPTVTTVKEPPSPAVDLESLDTLVHSPEKENTDDELRQLQKQHTRLALSSSVSLPSMSLQQPRRRLSMNLPHSASVPSSPSPEKKARDDLNISQFKVTEDIPQPEKESKPSLKAFIRSNFSQSTKTKQKFRKSVTFSPAEKELIAQTIEKSSSNNNNTQPKPEPPSQPEPIPPSTAADVPPLQKDAPRKQDMKSLLSLVPEHKKPRLKRQGMSRWEKTLLQMQYFAAITFATGWMLSNNSSLVTMLHSLITAFLLSALQPAKTADAAGEWLRQMIPPLNTICIRLQASASSPDQQLSGWKRMKGPLSRGVLLGSNYLFGVALTTIILLGGRELTPHLETRLLVEAQRALIIAFFALYVETIFD